MNRILRNVLVCIAMATASGAAEKERVCISGVYPHLAVFNSVMDEQGRTSRTGGECGIGAVVPWAGKLWLITYSPHCPKGSTDKLFAIDEKLHLEIRPESIGGTPAGRMIHRESEQLFIGPYAIDKNGKVRVIPYSRMPGRHTAVSRHLVDPANKVYYFDMEGRIYEVDVNSLDVTLLFKKPVPGWHGKGGYTGQGRYVIANNGERSVKGHPLNDLKVGAPPTSPEEMGVLAEWDGTGWRIVERRQFTEVTGPDGIYGSPNDTSPVWSIGWDRRSVILKLLDGGTWRTFRLPKGTWTYDGVGGWYTEWPRIREIAPGKLMMDMHGIFWDFPKAFTSTNTGGLRPMATHHRYVPDFCHWNGRVVLASDDTSIMQNPMAGQSQSNLWFGKVEDIGTWGPRVGWGGPWVNDPVKANAPSDPFAIGGFRQRCLHLAVGGGHDATADGHGIDRCTRRFPLAEAPERLAALPRVTIARGDYHKPAPGYGFTVNQDVTVYIAVDDRPKADLGPGWERTDMTTKWEKYTDTVYRRAFQAGRVDIPGHPIAHKPDAYGVPHLCFVAPASGKVADLRISDLPAELEGQVTPPDPGRAAVAPAGDVTFTIEIDAKGDGTWAKHAAVTVPNKGYRFHILPKDLDACWARVTADRDCTATAYFRFGGPGHDPKDGAELFSAVADVDAPDCVGGLIRPAAHNRNLQALLQEGNAEQCREVDETMTFLKPTDDRSSEVRKVASVSRDFDVDAASVILVERGRRYRLPKGDERYDKPFATGRPRGIRECESERYLMNIHGTFYEKPREGGLAKVKPVAGHRKQIMDFCTWRGLLVISGTRKGAQPDGHYFGSDEGTGLWFGGIDDLWKLGKPVGQGGPWKDTKVEADRPSDPYLMTVYDRKTVELSHDAETDVTFAIEVNVDHTAWHTYKTVRVPSGQTVRHEFPEGYGAHWVRVRADKPCKATAWFVYE